MQSFFIEFVYFREELPMHIISIVLYGSPQSRELAKNLLTNLKEVKREEKANCPWEVRLAVFEPINETSLIPLLRQSGIHGFRLVETQD